MLSLEIGELGEAGFDLSLTGFDEFELANRRRLSSSASTTWPVLPQMLRNRLARITARKNPTVARQVQAAADRIRLAATTNERAGQAG
jgi:hypothetical protein